MQVSTAKKISAFVLPNTGSLLMFPNTCDSERLNLVESILFSLPASIKKVSANVVTLSIAGIRSAPYHSSIYLATTPVQ